MNEERSKKYTNIETAVLDWDAKGDAPFAPRSIFFDDIYFSGQGIDETSHVFIDGNNLKTRFATATNFTIAELGFGTGLNFLVTQKVWRDAQRSPGAHLHFFSIEKYPLTDHDLRRAHQAWPELECESDMLRRKLPPAVSGFYRLAISDDVTLTLFYGDVHDGLHKAEAKIDAWFLDGFSPATNPEMWSSEIFSEISRLSQRTATVATFTVAGTVRRALSDAGFIVEKRPGFGRKREMLTAQCDASTHTTNRAPWTPATTISPLKQNAKVAVIGGGVAGASLIHSLRRYKLSPTLYETTAPAAGASGNQAGLIMPRLDLDDTPAARFFRQAYVHTVSLLNNFNQYTEENIFNACGVKHTATDDDTSNKIEKILANNLLPEGWIEKCQEGLFFPQAGVINPRRFVTVLLDDTPQINETVTKITINDSITIETNRSTYTGFSAAILANSTAAIKLLQARTLPLSSVAGQLDYFPNTLAPDHAIAAGPYLSPAPGGGVIAGATYDKLGRNQLPNISRAATEQNIQAAQQLAPNIAHTLDANAAIPRVSVRCQSPDRLPIAGPLPDWAFYSGAYDDLRFGKKLNYPVGLLQQGIYSLTALGSRGLVTAPLCAELIVSEMVGAPNPVGHDIAEILHPARFFIRSLKRARPVKK